MKKLALFAIALAVLLPAAGTSAADVPPGATIDVSGSPAVVNAGPGDQVDPHVSGNLISYTDFSGSTPQIRYHDLAAASDAGIPNGSNFDIVAAIHSSTIVYTHVAGASQSIFQFDTATPATPPEDLDPQPNSLRDNPSVGGQTIAWEDFAPNPQAPEIAVYDRAAAATQLLTNDLAINVNPAVSPAGDSVAWAKCVSPGAGCRIWSATLSGGVWTLHQLTTDGEAELPGDDGSIVAYDVTQGATQDIYWQPVDGSGAESHLVLSGRNRNANVSQGVISFEHLDPSSATPNWDVYAYDTNTGLLYKVADSANDEILSDVSVSGQAATVTWSVQEPPKGYNVYAQSFLLHRPPRVAADHAQVEVGEGSQATSTGSVSDPDGGPVTLSASVGHVTDNGDGTWSWSLTPDDGPSNSQTVTITATDPDGLTGTASFQLVVDNIPPSAVFGAPSSTAAGSAFTLSLGVPSDPSSADTAAGFAYAFDCGNGSGYSAFSSSPTRGCTALATPGPIAVRAQIRDKDGGVSTYSAAVQVTAPAAAIAFTSTRDGNSEIYAMNADGSHVTRLTNNRAIDAGPAWSPDHSKLAFVSTRDGNSEIYSMNANGTGVTRLTSSRAADVTPAWSPDGSKLAFSSDRDGNFEIYVMNANGSGVTRLTNTHAADVTPAWSADGSKIVFSSDRDDNFEIYAVNPDGTGLVRLTNNRALDTLPAA